MCSLKQLGVALYAYHNAYGSFPPAYIADAGGKPMHSWRVLLLPFLDRKDLYAKYRCDEPWDGPHNRKLLGQMPECFHCPSESEDSNPTDTSYVAVIGTHTAWRGDRPVGLTEFTDNLDTTLLLIETKNSGIPWLEPRDLTYPPMSTAINAASGQGIASNHPCAAIVLFADGSVPVLSDDCKEVAALLTIDGGEIVSKDDL